ncbi:MAG: Crp/Fnr family transcriptional regulator [Euryhalocaulis sp.]|uniref:Crp/Fnr family transcriptional regulator n=2 Tax=Euryhalocaulis TaxID=1712422 RepID=UPI00181AF4AD|nr:Crp/Fnr family transcriptional regulator [Euryhalocaulis sp.]MBA4802929.1 Crp/Fnr family transcriptional regulator [Euryhalocaulis sp.]
MAMGNNIAHTLNHSPFARRLQNCGGMADADLGALDGIHQDLVRLGKGETLATAGHAPDRILVIEDGWAFRFQLLDDGGRQITEILAPGDMLNCEALSRLSPGHAAEALTPVTMRAFQAQEFLKTVQTTPGIAAALWWSEFQIDNMLREQITRLGRRDAQSRIAHFFLELLMRARCAGVIRGGMIEAPLSQSHLADLLGLTPVHVSRTLRRLNGMVKWTRRSVCVTDEDALCRVAGFDAAYLNLQNYAKYRMRGQQAVAE